MKNNPLIDALAILMCLIAVIALGHYFESKKKQKENLPYQIEQPKPKIDLSRFEAAVKHTE